MKIAIFKRLGECSYEVVHDDGLEGIKEYVRLTEYVDVEFPPLASEEVVQRQINALDQAESELRAKFQAALNGLEQQRAELRAITLK